MAQHRTQDPDISRAHIIYVRHGPATSNHNRPHAQGIEGSRLTLAELQKLANELDGPTGPSMKFRTAEYLPDGLSQAGLDAADTFVKVVTNDGRRKLRNVYMLGCSPLTRAFQTLQRIERAFELVGPLNFPNRGTAFIEQEPIKRCHPGLQEATCFPQDLPALTSTHDRKRIASYIKIVGGDRDDPGGVLGEEEVDLTNMVWPEGMPNEWATLDSRMEAITAPPSLKAIEDRAKDARIWLREWVKQAAQAHQSEGGEGTLRIVICGHGGMINFLTGSWYCNFTRKSDSDEWEWAGSAALGNLEVAVYTFESPADEDAKLKELDWDEYYSEVFGKHYRHMATDQSLIYKKPDGTHLDQKAAHWRFIQYKAAEVCAVAEERKALMKALLNWRGAQHFLEGQ